MYVLLHYYIKYKLSNCVLPLIFQIKENKSNNMDKPKRKYDNHSDYNNSNYKRDRIEKNERNE